MDLFGGFSLELYNFLQTFNVYISFYDYQILYVVHISTVHID